MSFVFAMPEYVSAAASDLANIASIISSANAAALGPTSGVLAAGADEVSATIAALFDAHAQAYQALSAQAAMFHQQFVQLMSGGAAQYAMTEAANASPLQTVGQGVMGGVSAPAQAAAAAPPAGNSATGILTTGASGGPGAFGPGGNGAAGWLMGSVGGGPAAAAVGSGGFGESFGIGGAGYTGSLVAGVNVGGVPAAGGSGGLVGSGGAVGAVESAELGIGGPPAAAVPDSAVTPLAAVPAAAPVSPAAAAARPGTPAYSPATAAAAESSDE
jgi:hypothetical protein